MGTILSPSSALCPGTNRSTLTSQFLGEASPLTIVSSVSTRYWVQTDRGTTESGGALTAILDQTGSHTNTVNGAPVYTASDSSFNNLPTVTGDGVDDEIVTSFMPPDPDVEQTVFYAILKQVTWTNADQFCGAGLNTFGIRQVSASPQLDHLGNASSSANTAGATIGSWARVLAQFDPVTCTLWVAGNSASGVVVQTIAAASPLALLSRNAASFGNFALFAFIAWNGMPTGDRSSGELGALDDYFRALAPGVILF